MILIMEYWWWHADRKTKAPAPLPTMIWAMSKTIKKECSSYNFSWFELRKLKANHGDETHSLSSEFAKGKSSKHARKIHQVARYEYTRFTRQEFTSFVHSRHICFPERRVWLFHEQPRWLSRRLTLATTGCFRSLISLKACLFNAIFLCNYQLRS